MSAGMEVEKTTFSWWPSVYPCTLRPSLQLVLTILTIPLHFTCTHLTYKSNNYVNMGQLMSYGYILHCNIKNFVSPKFAKYATLNCCSK